MINIALFFTQMLLLSCFYQYACRLGLAALQLCVVLLTLLANVLVLKTVSLLGLDVTACDAYSVLGFWVLNTIQRDYGLSAARQSIVLSLVTSVLVAAMFAVHLGFEPSQRDSMQQVYVSLLSPLVSIMVISTVVFACSQGFEVALFQLLRVNFTYLSEWCCSYLSVVFALAVDTALFTALALDGWGMQFWHVFTFSYGLKLTMLVMVSPFVMFQMQSVASLIKEKWQLLVHKHFVKAKVAVG